jgi:thiamine-phosphate pyrophosphorylase
LYGFVDTAYLAGRRVDAVAGQLCEGGVDVLQLRAKGLPPAEVRRLAESILPVTQRAGVPLVINDHLSVALQAGAQACHLGQEDFFGAGYTQVEQLFAGAPARLAIGLSTHAPEQARRAVTAGAAYLGIGPVYRTDTKPGAQPVSLDYVRWAAANLNVPWFAIGGINLDNLGAVLAAGARRICVVSAILSAPDVTEACRQFKARLLAAPL